ncbi:hypothetical protein [Breoghania sp.]|uniref:hypothetical protein n=1 Tax=Breoghania sp. TaxID=2065378 RepID=UPI0029CA1C93|nr:hypothetical protein [Breoghania sp.]
MIGKLGILLLALVAVFAIFRFLGTQGRKADAARQRKSIKAEKTLVKDPQTGRYRATDDRGGGEA